MTIADEVRKAAERVLPEDDDREKIIAILQCIANTGNIPDEQVFEETGLHPIEGARLMLRVKREQLVQRVVLKLLQDTKEEARKDFMSLGVDAVSASKVYIAMAGLAIRRGKGSKGIRIEEVARFTRFPVEEVRRLVGLLIAKGFLAA